MQKLLKQIKYNQEKLVEFLIFAYLLIIFGIFIYRMKVSFDSYQVIAATIDKKYLIAVIPTPTPIPTTIPTPTPKRLPILKTAATGKTEWGVAKQIGEHTWTTKVGNDVKVGSTQDILQALNNYRARHGKGTLAWSDTLGSYAQGRASSFAGAGKLDSHAGFNDYISNQDGFHKLGFMGLGENSCLGYTLEGVHLIEWVFAADAPHNDNQLNSAWSHVGIGVSGTAVDIIFGGSKM